MANGLSLSSLARLIDHSLLHPTLTDGDCARGCELAAGLGTASVCVKPHAVAAARKILSGSGTAVCAVNSFPHGNAAVSIKAAEAALAVDDGATEIDSVVTLGKVLGEEWDDVAAEIKTINETVTGRGALLKVIFEIDFLEDGHVKKLCEICSNCGVAFVKTSTGFGFVKRADGTYSAGGATERAVRLMRASCPASVGVKAAGGIRTLDDLLAARSWGANRIGTSSTKAILEEARRRGLH